MKNLKYLVLVILFSCGDGEKPIGSNEGTTTALSIDTQKKNTQSKSESNFDCYIKYLDAVFLQKATDCEEPKPVQLSIDSNSRMVSPNTDLVEVVLQLDSLTGRETKFEFNLGFSGAVLTNYTDSLYALERAEWISEYQKKTNPNADLH